MSTEISVISGSGLAYAKKSTPKGGSLNEISLRGVATAVINPEDASASLSGVASAVTVDTSPVLLPTTPLKYRRALGILNNDNTNILYIGFNAEVTTSNGWPIAASNSISLDINGDVKVYGVGSASGVDVRLLELA